jgi:hypothetical protein
VYICRKNEEEEEKFSNEGEGEDIKGKAKELTQCW